MFVFPLPEIGEGVVEGEIVRWLVNVGDTVARDQPLCEIMTDKATVEISSPKSGRVAKTYGSPGDVVKVHSPLVDIDVGGASQVAPPPPELVRSALAKLDLPPKSSFEDARTAHRELLQVWHPDRHSKNARLQARATLKSQELNSAWDTVRAWHEQTRQGDAERVARQQAEAERQARDAAERERRARAEREQQARAERDRQDQLRREREHAERVRRAWEQSERERIDRERATERAEEVRRAWEQDERERIGQRRPTPAGASTGTATTATDGVFAGGTKPLTVLLAGMAVAGWLMLAFGVYGTGSFHILPADQGAPAPTALAGPSVAGPDQAAGVVEVSSPTELQVGEPPAPGALLPASEPGVAPITAIAQDALAIVREAPVLPPPTANDEPVDKWLGTKRDGDITTVVEPSQPSPAERSAAEQRRVFAEGVEQRRVAAAAAAIVDREQSALLVSYQSRATRELMSCFESELQPSRPRRPSLQVKVDFPVGGGIVPGLPSVYAGSADFNACISRRLGALSREGIIGGSLTVTMDIPP